MDRFTSMKSLLDDEVYFIADIGANHDGELEKAKELIFLAAEAGANAAKFQHFSAETIVSNYEFSKQQGRLAHQKNWTKTVFEIYKEASLDSDWNKDLRDTCLEAGIDFFTSPYSIELVDQVDSLIPAYKIGSGDITWMEIIQHIAKKKKPTFLATGASDIEDVHRAVNCFTEWNQELCLMQCNTNYTASIDNFRYLNLNVLKLYADMYPHLYLGLSDHSPGHASVLGAVSLGARAVEKHFTDDNSREGPDHKFAMDPKAWREMVDRTRELELALGDGVKRVESNEKESCIVQRRAVCAAKDLPEGLRITAEDLCVLRPCSESAIPANELTDVIGAGAVVNKFVPRGASICWSDLSK